ncbi:MAG: sulfite exporter TauE/SafE family protein, partial [Alphaproteobacteria bacterium]|nr:sulfite exporter TauE/SafE family protein [Alphaproteobacteria bacterium]
MWEDFALYVAVGFLAQLVDGAIGMAFGLLGTSVMMAGGVAPAIASASVHAAEVFTTALSGISHWRFGNVRWRIVGRLALPGAIGGALGAYILTRVPVDIIKPVVNVYTLCHGALDPVEGLPQTAGRNRAA